jgi:hypothetical protein
MDFHAHTRHGSELIAQVIDGQLVIVPPLENSPEIPQQQSPPALQEA